MMLVVFVFSVANVVMAIIMLLLARITKFEGFTQIRQNPKGLQLYVKIEAYIVGALMAISLLSFGLHTQGADFATFRGDRWWVEATSGSALIAWLAGLLRVLQRITWDCGLPIKCRK